MLTIVLIAVFVYILSRLPLRAATNDKILDVLIKDTHRYSGIHEDSYSQFYANIQMAREYKSDVFLHKAIQHLNEIPLYMSPIDPDVQGDIAELGQKIMNTFKR